MKKRIHIMYLLVLAAFTASLICSILHSPLATVFLTVTLILTIWATVLQELERRRLVREEADLKAQTRERIAAAEAEMEKVSKESRDHILQFHSKVSHCLRIPISVIQGYADLLKGDMIADKDIQKEYLAKISEKVEYLNELLGQLLLEARTSADIPSLMPQPVNICELVEKTAEDISAAARRLSIAIHVTSSEPVIMVSADVNLLTKIFYNILGNSLKYMKREGSINITVSRVDNEVMMIFKDDGCGLNEEETKRIFELNYQGSNKMSGDGFGLYYAKNGILAHGGKIFAKSGIGMGMGIYITLPIG